MEGKEDTHSSGVTKGEEVPASHQVPVPVPVPVPAMAENPSQFTGSATPAVLVTPVSAAVATENNSQFSGSAMALVSVAPASVTAPSTEGKKKRGRPRKYGPDGKPTLALSPMPISASIPLAGEFSGWKNGRGRPVDSFKKKHKLEFESPGVQLAYSGANFTPHVITVNAGEDVSMKIISFSQEGSRAICILAANGSISNVTLRQPNSSGGTLTYEGRFEILSLSGSFTPTDNGGLAKSRSGGMSVSLAGPDGRVLGGGLAGLLVAAGPVQVVIASFMSSHQQEPKPKKQRAEYAPTLSPIPVYPISSEGTKAVPCSVPKPNPASSFHGDNSVHGSKIIGAENNNVSFPSAESIDLSSSKFEVSC